VRALLVSRGAREYEAGAAPGGRALHANAGDSGDVTLPRLITGPGMGSGFSP